MGAVRHIPLIVELHAEEAAILWSRRNTAVNAPHYNREFLGRLDERLEANIDGLRIAGDVGWAEAQKAFAAHPEPGEAFVLAAIAFGRETMSGINDVLEALGEEDNQPLVRAAISALGWLLPSDLRGKVQSLLKDPRPQARLLGLGACSTHRVDPGPQLVEFLRDVPAVRDRAARLAGEVGRSDLLAELKSGDLTSSGAAVFARVLLGDLSALPQLQKIATRPGPDQWPAFDLALLAMGEDAARTWLKELGNTESDPRYLVRSAGLLGDPALVPWLIRQMETPLMARLAGESLSLITGVDIDFMDLDGEPGDSDTVPNDDPADDLVELDMDDELPTPDPAKVAAWWEEAGASYQSHQRYFLGALRLEQTYRDGFENGYQRQRKLAALNLALITPDAAMLNWKTRVS